jgi:ferritin
MISKSVTQAINEQINRELFSSYLYKSMALHAESESLIGTSKWMAVQEGEERSHAEKFMKYLLDQGERVTLGAIAQPQTEFGGLKDIFEKTLEHEKLITASIKALADLAAKENDYATSIFLQWFITEQVEEEKNASEVLAKLKLIGGSTGSLYMLDKELGKRAQA